MTAAGLELALVGLVVWFVDSVHCKFIVIENNVKTLQGYIKRIVETRATTDKPLTWLNRISIVLAVHFKLFTKLKPLSKAKKFSA